MISKLPKVEPIRQPALQALPKRKAEFIEPMECAPVPKLPDGPEWLFEIKLDGYRAIEVKTSCEDDIQRLLMVIRYYEE